MSSEKGFSVVEGLIAAGLMSVIALSTVSVLYNIRKSTSSTNSVCMSYTQGVLSKFRSLGQFSEIYPFYPTTGTSRTLPVYPVLTAPLAGIDLSEAIRWQIYGGGEILTTGNAAAPYDSPIVRTYRTINSSVNAVLSIYNTDPAGYCAGKDVSNIAGVGRPILAVPPTPLVGVMPSDLLADAVNSTDANAPVVTYKIKPYNAVTGAPVACINPLAIVPPPNRGAGLNRADDTGNPYPYGNTAPNLPVAGAHLKTPAQKAVVQLDTGQLSGGANATEVGLLFNVKVAYKTKNNGGTFDDGSCESESRFQYEKSLSQPAPPINYTISNTFLGAGAATGTNSFRIQLGYSGANFLKPGNVLLCRDRSQYPSGFLASIATDASGNVIAPTTSTLLLGNAPGAAGINPALVPCFASEADAQLNNPALTKYNVIAFGSNFQMTPRYFPQISTAATPSKNGPIDGTGLKYDDASETTLDVSRWRPCDEVTACGVNPVAPGTIVANQYMQLDYNNLPQYCRIRIEVVVVDAAMNQNNNSNSGAGLAPALNRQSAFPVAPSAENPRLDGGVYGPITTISYANDRDVNFAMDPGGQCGRFCLDLDTATFPNGYYIPAGDACTYPAP